MFSTQTHGPQLVSISCLCTFYLGCFHFPASQDGYQQLQAWIWEPERKELPSPSKSSKKSQLRLSLAVLGHVLKLWTNHHDFPSRQVGGVEDGGLAWARWPVWGISKRKRKRREKKKKAGRRSWKGKKQQLFLKQHSLQELWGQGKQKRVDIIKERARDLLVWWRGVLSRQGVSCTRSPLAMANGTQA